MAWVCAAVSICFACGKRSVICSLGLSPRATTNVAIGPWPPRKFANFDTTFTIVARSSLMRPIEAIFQLQV